jgi:uncharacterized protein
VIRRELIERAVELIVAQCDPEQVFVVGSHATGTATATSDLDLLVVMYAHEGREKRRARIERLLSPLLIPVDVHVFTPAELEDESSQPYAFARTAPREGWLVYSRALGRCAVDFDARRAPAGPL